MSPIIISINQINSLIINIHVLTDFSVNLRFMIKYTGVKNNIWQKIIKNREQKQPT